MNTSRIAQDPPLFAAYAQQKVEELGLSKEKHDLKPIFQEIEFRKTEQASINREKELEKLEHRMHSVLVDNIQSDIEVQKNAFFIAVRELEHFKKFNTPPFIKRKGLDDDESNKAYEEDYKDLKKLFSDYLNGIGLCLGDSGEKENWTSVTINKTKEIGPVEGKLSVKSCLIQISDCAKFCDFLDTLIEIGTDEISTPGRAKEPIFKRNQDRTYHKSKIPKFEKPIDELRQYLKKIETDLVRIFKNTYSDTQNEETQQIAMDNLINLMANIKEVTSRFKKLGVNCDELDKYIKHYEDGSLREYCLIQDLGLMLDRVADKKKDQVQEFEPGCKPTMTTYFGQSYSAPMLQRLSKSVFHALDLLKNHTHFEKEFKIALTNQLSNMTNVVNGDTYQLGWGVYKAEDIKANKKRNSSILRSNIPGIYESAKFVKDLVAYALDSIPESERSEEFKSLIKSAKHEVHWFKEYFDEFELWQFLEAGSRDSFEE